jgi:N-acetylglucosamine transport system substrate-binding protein
MSVTPDSTSDLTRRTLLRRAAAAGLLASPAAGLLAACAGGSGKKEDTGGGAKSEDNPWCEFDKTVFNKKHANVTVNLSATQKIKTEEQPKMATTPSDLIMNSGADMMDMSTLINENAIEPLDDLLDAPAWDTPGSKVRDTLVGSAVKDGTFNGKYYAVNVANTLWGVWHDAALFEKEGWTAPTTFDEFFQLAPKIKAKGMAPFVHDAIHGYYPRWALMASIWKSAGKQAVIDIDNLKENAWSAEGVLPALEAWEKLVKDGYLLPGSLDHTKSQQAWLDHKAAFIQVGTWLANEMAKTIPPGFKLKVTDYWKISSSDKNPDDVFAGTGESFVVPSKAPNKAAAKEFLRAVLSKEGSKNFAAKTQSLASTQGSGEGLDAISVTSANDVMKGAKGTISFKFDSFYAQLDKESQTLSEELMAGRLSAKDFIKKMQTAADKVAKDSSIKKQTRTE